MATKKVCDRCGAEINPFNSVTYVGMRRVKNDINDNDYELCVSCACKLRKWFAGGGELTMAEYIDKIALLKDLSSTYNCTDECWSDDYTMGFRRAVDIVNKALPLKVAIVKHGQWIEDHEYLRCSECGAMVRQDSFFDDIGDWNYCPNCGARCDLDSQARMLDISPETKILLDNVPDIESIVRCKECEYRGDHNCPMFHLVPSGEYVDFARDEGFCHRGYSKKQPKPMKFNWRHPTQKSNGMWIPDGTDCPYKYAYHILQVKSRDNDKLYAYNDGDYIVAKYNSMLECGETASNMDYIHWDEVKRWAVLTDNNGCPITNMGGND